MSVIEKISFFGKEGVCRYGIDVPAACGGNAVAGLQARSEINPAVRVNDITIYPIQCGQNQAARLGSHSNSGLLRKSCGDA